MKPSKRKKKTWTYAGPIRTWPAGSWTDDLQAAQRTLNGITFDEFWDRVIRRVAPKADANARIRSRSLAKAGHHVLD
jgi:hypothetical protein